MTGATQAVHTEIAKRVAAGGKVFTEETIAAFAPAYAAIHAAHKHANVSIDTDISYSTDVDRNLLDVHATPDRTGKKPVVIFFHGGGLVGGHKTQAGSPFYGNVANFFAANGAIGVNATYRLAPAVQWPEGARDVGAALAWARANIGRYGGDPERIVLMGHSAGATHVASYVFRKELHTETGGGFAGAILASGVYGIDAENPPPNHVAYYGKDKTAYATRQLNGNVTSCNFPMLFTIAEFDPVRFESSAYGLLEELVNKGAPRPHITQFRGHNHITPAMAIGSGDAQVEDALLGFLQRI